jgi:hypothetical protein
MAGITDRQLKDRINTYAEALTDDWPYVPVADAVVDMARKHFTGVHNYPISLGCALVHQESWFRNIMGCDWGSRWTWEPPYCQVLVTKGRVKKLIENIEDGGGQNGVGLCQLTDISFVREAEALGGAHIPRNQLDVGFNLLARLIKTYGYYGGVGAYNAGPGNRNAVRWTYTQSVEDKHNLWIARLT